MNDWNPNAPDLTRHFSGVPEPEPPRRPVSKWMLERRRQNTTPALDVPMPGSAGLNATAQAKEEREIRYVRERLAKQRGRAQRGLQRADFYIRNTRDEL